LEGPSFAGQGKETNIWSKGEEVIIICSARICLFSAATGSTTAEIPMVPLQGNIVRQSEDVGNHALVLNHVTPPDTWPFKIHYRSQNHNIATVDLVRQLWLAEQAAIDRFQSVHGEEDDCAIYLDPLKAKAVVVTTCQHVFHLDCCMKSGKSTSSLCKTGCWTCP
jgi:hypothetical protein